MTTAFPSSSAEEHSGSNTTMQATVCEPGYGLVRNVPATGRQIIERSRDLVEKKRLKERDFGFQRYRGETIDTPFEIDTASSGFMSAADRFHCDTVGEIKAMRAAARARLEARYQLKRERAQQTERRLRLAPAADDHDIKDDEGGEYGIIGSGSGGGRLQVNKNSVAYNPITLQYSDNDDGHALQREHARVLYRVGLRAQNLQAKSNGGFNPITGAPTTPVVTNQTTLSPPPF